VAVDEIRVHLSERVRFLQGYALWHRRMDRIKPGLLADLRRTASCAAEYRLLIDKEQWTVTVEQDMFSLVKAGSAPRVPLPVIECELPCYKLLQKDTSVQGKSTSDRLTLSSFDA